MFQYTMLAREYRGGVFDLAYFGYLVIVGEDSRILFKVGDPETTIFYRSSSKPLQALPVIMRGIDRRYGFTEEESVLFSGSHCGDPIHITALESMALKGGFREDMLVMKPAQPGRPENNEARICAGLPKRKFYHNCAGKHVALLLLQRELCAIPEDYWKTDSPAQTEVRQVLSVLGESKKADLKVGIDGCGVPVYATGIVNAAIAFKNLTAPDRIKDDELGKAVATYIPRIHRYPHMMSGDGYLVTILNRDPNLVAKSGANGVFCLALKKERIGVTMKFLDGTQSIFPLVVTEVLRGIGALSAETDERLNSINPSIIYNDNGTAVGYRELAFKVRL